MAIGGVITWAVVPIFKVFKYLAIEPELHRKRGRATAFVLTLATAAVVVIGLIRFPLHMEAIGVLEPEIRESVKARTRGFVDHVVAEDGQHVKPGDVILVCRSGELDAKIEGARAKLAGLVHQHDQAIAEGSDPNLYSQSIEAQKKELASLEQDRDRLTVRAAIEGDLIGPDLHDMTGKFLAEGQDVATVAQTHKLIVHTLMEQKDIQPVVGQANVKAEARFAGDIGTIARGGTAWVMPDGTQEARSALLTTIAGADAPADPRDPRKTQVPVFDIAIPLDNPDSRYVLGQRAYVRFTLDHKPLIWQWSRRFWQLLQSKSAGSQWM